jgi:hypothetical protein
MFVYNPGRVSGSFGHSPPQTVRCCYANVASLSLEIVQVRGRLHRRKRYQAHQTRAYGPTVVSARVIPGAT